MAKKKKHRNKSRKQRNRAAQSAQSDVVVAKQPEVAVKKTTTKSSVKPKTTTTASENIYDDVDLGYVKTDIRKTLILVALILAVYALLWILMTYTPFGTTSLRLLGK
jgi:ABC-type uncharacterized transport system permease subunit